MSGLCGFPAHAGIDPDFFGKSASWNGLPRARGDRPPVNGTAQYVDLASPRTRGSTVDVEIDVESGRGFPAHAGIDPSAGPDWT